MLHEDLNVVLVQDIEAVMRHYGIEHWEAAVVLFNPRAAATEWVLVCKPSVDPQTIAAVVAQDPHETLDASP